MNAVKSQALEVLNMELATPHGPGVDMIHNMLSDMDDNELFEGIIKPGKSLSNSLQFAASKAKEYVSNGIAVVPDEFVLNAVIEYFKSNKTNVQAVASLSTAPNKKGNAVSQNEMDEDTDEEMDEVKLSKKVKATKKSEVDLQMSMFDLFGDEVNGNR